MKLDLAPRWRSLHQDWRVILICGGVIWGWCGTAGCFALEAAARRCFATWAPGRANRDLSSLGFVACPCIGFLYTCLAATSAAYILIQPSTRCIKIYASVQALLNDRPAVMHLESKERLTSFPRLPPLPQARAAGASMQGPSLWEGAVAARPRMSTAPMHGCRPPPARRPRGPIQRPVAPRAHFSSTLESLRSPYAPQFPCQRPLARLQRLLISAWHLPTPGAQAPGTIALRTTSRPPWRSARF